MEEKEQKTDQEIIMRERNVVIVERPLLSARSVSVHLICVGAS